MLTQKTDSITENFVPTSDMGTRVITISNNNTKGSKGPIPMIQRQSENVTVSSPAISETLRQAGAVTGAVEGRPLSPDEHKLAKSVFKNSIDYDRVRLATTGPTWTTSGNVIFVPDDFSLKKGMYAQIFIHEMTHVWQYQHGGSEYISISLGRQVASWIKTGSRGGAYEYKIKPDSSIFDFKPEQQASIVQEYFVLQQRKAKLKKEGKAVPSDLEGKLKQHERLVKELTTALPRSEVQLIQRTLGTTQYPGLETGRSLEEQPSQIIPLLRIRF
jgi:hypothetical protein